MRKNEEGQALILLMVALSIFLLGAVGIGVDAGHLYAQKQLAQNAADAAAQAGINQETGLLGRQQCGVPSTGRREYPTLDDKDLPQNE